MKGGTLQITWHGSDPVLTLDFHRTSGLLATGGADHDIKMWLVHQSDSATLPSATFQSSLSYHTAAVNVVRFSSAGDQLASGADGGEVLLWKLNPNLETPNTWKLAKNLRFHIKDVLDLEWSPDGMALVSGSVDNSVIIWDCVKGTPQQVLKDHMHYVQGVAWDPAGQYIATLSGDRTCRLYNYKHLNKSSSKEKGMFVCRHVLVKAEVSKQETTQQEGDAFTSKVPAAKQSLFYDETLPSFFRRLSWSPDGSFLLVPSGVHKFPQDSVMSNTAFIFSRKDLSRPAVQLPGASKPIVAVRFCPVVFSLQANMELNDSTDAPFKLPYRLIFAVATLNSLYIYDTQSPYPLGILAGLHYAAITDIAWSWDAKFLAVSSQDGFCTLVAFDSGELGNPLPSNELPSHVAEYIPSAKESALGMPANQLSVFSESTNLQDKVQCQGQAPKNLDAMEHMTPEKDQTSSKPSLTARMLSAKDGCLSDVQQISPLVASGKAIAANTQRDTTSQMGSVKSRRITPIAVAADSACNQGAPIAQDGSIWQISPPVVAAEKDLSAITQANDNLQVGSVKPRRITPVPIFTESACQQEACGSRDGGSEKHLISNTERNTDLHVGSDKQQITAVTVPVDSALEHEASEVPRPASK